MLQLIIVILASVSIGLFSWFSSDTPLMIRELVLNSRKQTGQSENQTQLADQYKNATLLSQFRKIFAVVVWVVGFVAVIIMIVVRLRYS